jgi:phage tail-like protein
MAETGVRLDPFPAFRFLVIIDAVPVGGFSECTGLQLDFEIHDFIEGGLNTHTHKFPTRNKQTNLVLKRGIISRELWQWYWQLVQGEVILRNVTILLFDHDGYTLRAEWVCERGLPARWIGPQLNATQNSVATETLEIAHHGLNQIV